ncbi:MobA/MobL family protein [Luteimonas fraxinea]|uniref:MobA/MobL family protein n=1 Tax=Luteimonas fraxinea TaxID=2901869 RepID=UPI001E538711|nr:MobA/MobL family protein [Luteimonas fraxinea]UHH09667.1 MobA/MobL family protein [Luteimonas fraxinea]
MAIYHANIKNFSRGKGESSMAAAAYRTGVDLVDTQTREIHRYSLRRGVVSFRMLAPKGAPEWCLDIHRFWQANEAAESRANARVGRELEVSLPSELSPGAREALALALGQMLVDRYSCAVLVAIHAPSERGDQRNFHTHLLMSARQVGPGALGARAGAAFDARGGAGADEVKAVREVVSGIVNTHLAAAGRFETVDHRSLVDQSRAAAAAGDFERAAALNRPPTRYRGKAITAMLRKGVDPRVFRHPAVQLPATTFDQAVELAAQSGTFVPPSAGHSHASALADHQREHSPAITAASEVYKSSERIEPLGSLHPRGSGRGALNQVPSPTALHLSRVARLMRANGNGAEVLNAEAEMIEAWLENLNEIARNAVIGIGAVPGAQIEPVLRSAMACASVRRVEAHASSRYFFESAEELAAAIAEYAAAYKVPFEAARRVDIARSELLALSGLDGRDPKVKAVRQELTKAKALTTSGARYGQDERVRIAKAAMLEAQRVIETDFPTQGNVRHLLQNAAPLDWRVAPRGAPGSSLRLS